MDADDHPVEVVLKEARRFKVPLYQRKYQWGDKQLEPFWEDVSAKATEVLEGGSKFQHYMGALILAPVDTGSQIGITPIVQVVDGQQRLTTFQLFLAALREVARQHESSDLIDHINGYLFNTPKSKDKDELARYKLTPTPSDRDIFHDIVGMEFAKVTAKYYKLFFHGRVPKNTSSPALRAYWVFFQWITDFVLTGPSTDAIPDPENMEPTEMQEGVDPVGVENKDGDVFDQRLEALLSAVLDRLKLVVITLGENDDAQVIFETLNSKGEPLLAMDLVRNNIFHRAEKQNAPVEELYKKLWDPLDDSWWREAAPNARPRRPRLDHFLAHVLTAETGKKVSIRELYAEYRAFASPSGKPRFPEVEKELAVLEKYSPLYESLEGRTEVDQTLVWLGKKLSDWQVTTAYPIAMQIGVAEISIEEKEHLAKLIYSFLVRRTLCGLTTKNLNNVFQSIASDFREKGVSLTVFRSYFDGKSGDSTRYPDDDELHLGLVKNNAYSISPRTRLLDILWEFEQTTRSNMAEKMEMPSDLWIEHVMPQAWYDEWPLESDEEEGSPAHDDLIDKREKLINTMGNLTLLTSKLNISAGKSGFDTKKAKFATHTGLFLNKWFADADSWSEPEISARTEHLSAFAKDIWIGLN